MRPKRTAICEHCGTEFPIRQRTKANRFCSPECYRTGRMRPLIDRFTEKIDIRSPDECWEWQGSDRNSSGYGSISAGRKNEGTLASHRLAYELFIGPIPDGLFVCHSCDNPPCCNPAHLFLGTELDNMRDKIAKGRATPPSNQRLSNAEVDTIRRRYSAGGISQYQLADEYGVTQSLIHLIVSGKHRA